MPYPLLDAIERAAIRDKKGPVEVFQTLMRGQFPEIDPASSSSRALGRTLLPAVVSQPVEARALRAFSFHVDDKNLDPKTWCRFPILSGGFERELDELHAHVEAEVGD